MLAVVLATAILATPASSAPAVLRAFERQAVDNVPADVVRSMVACWTPPAEGDEITLRMSFRRDGTVFGKPRITYIKTSGGPDGEARLANSIHAAIAACTPLRFTPSLGAAIAGRVFLIRFVAPRRTRSAAL